jgi:flavin-dependent dehydrogenase
MVVGRDAYVGLARVPGGRLNIGVVLGPSWLAGLSAEGAAPTVRRVLDAVPRRDDDPVDWGAAPVCDRIAGASPLGMRVTRRAGPGWFLVGDACGFLDPFTGEGIHRALVSTELAAPAILSALGRGRDDADAARAAAAYDRAMTPSIRDEGRGVMARPDVPRTSAGCSSTPRDGSPNAPAPRATMGLVMGDLIPASRGLDPRFLAALLAP